MFFKKDYSKNRIHFYAVLKKSDSEKKIYTLTTSVNDAMEYAESMIQLDHFEHYSKWCDLRNLDMNDLNTWNTYYDNCVNDEEKMDYAITKISYSGKYVASMLRMFANCIPLGCSYENEAELEKYKSEVNTREQMLKLQNAYNLMKDKLKVEDQIKAMADDEIDPKECE